MSLNVVLVDDHQVFRDALRALLTRQPDINLLADTGSGREGCALVETRRPDVVVLDIALPGFDGYSTAKEMRRRQPSPKILFLSMHRDEIHVARALEAGGRGYVCKEQPANELLEAIRAVGRGEEYLPPQLSRFALDEERARLRQGENANGHGAAPPPVSGDGAPADQSQKNAEFDRLTTREKEVFKLLVKGDNNRTIAQNLHLSVKTVETHRARILKKLEAHTLADLVRFAARNAML